jgi:hypothetical protein
MSPTSRPVRSTARIARGSSVSLRTKTPMVSGDCPSAARAGSQVETARVSASSSGWTAMAGGGPLKTETSCATDRSCASGPDAALPPPAKAPASAE